MSLKTTIDNILEERKRSMSWLASEMDRTLEGLKLSLTNETIKFTDLKKLIKVLNMPIAMLFEGDTTIQKIKGNYNMTQAGHSNMVAEPEGIYKRKEVESLEEQIRILKSQLIDKDEIIELLKQKNR